MSTPLEEAEKNVESIATAALPKLHWWSDSDTWSTLFSPIEDVVDQYLTVVIAQINEGDVDKVIQVIKARREKLPLSTGITNQILGICQQILAFGAAGLALTIGFLDKVRAFSVPLQKLLAVVGIFYFELIIVSLLVLVWYILQAHFRYPFLYFNKIGNAWPWFYYASISEVPRGPIQLAGTRFRASTSYAKDFLRFAEKSVTEQPHARLRTELQQYFLLMAYSGYVQQFSLRLANLFAYGFAGSVASALVVGVLVWKGVL
jgi:hypothetical protein